MTDEDIISDILRREGGYVDHPADKGGTTNWGITKATLAAHRMRPVTEDDVKALSEDEARSIYRQRYIIDTRLHRIVDTRLRALLVDMAVLHGARNAIKMLQKVVGVREDGILGPVTWKAIDNTTRVLVTAERARFFGRILSRDQSQYVFAAGWMNRLAEWIEEL